MFYFTMDLITIHADYLYIMSIQLLLCGIILKLLIFKLVVNLKVYKALTTSHFLTCYFILYFYFVNN